MIQRLKLAGWRQRALQQHQQTIEPSQEWRCRPESRTRLDRCAWGKNHISNYWYWFNEIFQSWPKLGLKFIRFKVKLLKSSHAKSPHLIVLPGWALLKPLDLGTAAGVLVMATEWPAIHCSWPDEPLKQKMTAIRMTAKT
jgi:hypothetical protein